MRVQRIPKYRAYLRAPACSMIKLALKMSFLLSKFHLNWGRGFESHTFQVIFNPLKCVKVAITQNIIKIYLKNCSKEVSANKQDSLSEGVPIIVHPKSLIRLSIMEKNIIKHFFSFRSSLALSIWIDSRIFLGIKYNLNRYLSRVHIHETSWCILS